MKGIKLPPPTGDTARVLREMLILGATNRDIAEMLGVTERTLSRYRAKYPRINSLIINIRERVSELEAPVCGTRAKYERGCRCWKCRNENQRYCEAYRTGVKYSSRNVTVGDLIESELAWPKEVSAVVASLRVDESTVQLARARQLLRQATWD